MNTINLKILPIKQHKFPIVGFMIKGNSAFEWLKRLDYYQIDINEVSVFPFATNIANEIGGCIVIFKHPKGLRSIVLEHETKIQQVNAQLYIPEYTTIEPMIQEWEILDLFKTTTYFIHPQFGRIPLDTAIKWEVLLNIQEHQDYNIITPAKATFIPQQIRSYNIHITDEDLQKELEASPQDVEALSKLFDMDKINAGNKREIKKLLDYLEKHPEKALELGIPLEKIDEFSRLSPKRVNPLSYIFGDNEKSNNSFIGRIADFIMFLFTRASTIFIIVGFIAISIFILSLISNVNSSTSELRVIPWKESFVTANICIATAIAYVVLFSKSEQYKRFKKLSFGQFSLLRQIIGYMVIIVALNMVLNPIISAYGYGITLGIFIILTIMVLIRLFNREKTLLFVQKEEEAV